MSARKASFILHIIINKPGELQNTKMNTKIPYLLLGLMLFAFSHPLSAQASADTARDLIIQRQMDCMSKQMNARGETVWESICAVDNFDSQAPDHLSGSSREDAKKSWDTAEERHREMGLRKDEKKIDFSEEYARENAGDIHAPKHQVKLGGELSYFRYKEPNVMNDEGVMQSIYGFYAYRPRKEDLFYTDVVNLVKADGRYGWGQVDYEAENGATIDNIDDWSAELRGILGKEYITDPYQIAIYSGFGYRYLNDDTSGKTSTVRNTTYYGYQRESNYYYIPIGFELSGEADPQWSFTVSGEYDWLVYGLQKSHLSDGNRFLSTKNDDAENPQHNGFGLRGSIKLTKESAKTNLILEPFFRYWSIEDSDVVSAFVDGATGNFVEPKNNTIEAGLNLGVQF